LLDSGNDSNPITNALVTADVTYWIYDGVNYTNHTMMYTQGRPQSVSGLYEEYFLFLRRQPDGVCVGCHSAHGGTDLIAVIFAGNYTAQYNSTGDNKIAASQVVLRFTAWDAKTVMAAETRIN